MQVREDDISDVLWSNSDLGERTVRSYVPLERKAGGDWRI
jgi:hypothetical protein